VIREAIKEAIRTVLKAVIRGWLGKLSEQLYGYLLGKETRFCQLVDLSLVES